MMPQCYCFFINGISAPVICCLYNCIIFYFVCFFNSPLFFFSKNLIMMLTNYTVVKSSRFFFKIQKVKLYFNHSGFWFYHFVSLRQETNCFVLHFHSPSRCTFFIKLIIALSLCCFLIQGTFCHFVSLQPGV